METLKATARSGISPSRAGRFSGNLPLLIGDVCSLTVTLPSEKTLYVLAAAVKWPADSLSVGGKFGELVDTNRRNHSDTE
jgi:hypothetical protein